MRPLSSSRPPSAGPPNGSTRVRSATEHDSHALWQIRAEAIHESAREHYSPEQLEAWATRRTPRSYHVPIQDGHILVAQSEDGAPVGFAQLNPGSGEVEALYVHPAWTRRGVGTRLLQELEERARAAGLQRLHLDASLNALRFYERAGYRIEHTVVHLLEKDVEITCAFMTKPLP